MYNDLFLFIIQSSRVADAAYDNEWYHADLKYKKSIRLIMSRAQTPQFISAYKFSVSSLPTFSGVCIYFITCVLYSLCRNIEIRFYYRY